MNENMKAFQNDLKANRPSEYLAAELMHLKFPKCKVSFVGDDKNCYHLGDLKITLPNGKSVYVDVKNDKRWAETGNLNAEDELWKLAYEKHTGDGFTNGFMRVARYDYVIYLDVVGKQFLFIDFKKWKKEYRKYGNYDTSGKCVDSRGRKIMKHGYPKPYEITYGYLNPVDKMIDAGVVIGRASFDFDGSIDDYKNLRIVDVTTYKKAA